MAGKNEIKNKIVLEGESEYKKQLAQINRELKESKAAMKAAAAEYEAAGSSMTAMYQQGDALERTIRSQEEALELMGNQLKKVEQHYGANSREAVELRTKINNMRAELAKSQTQLREFEAGLENTADAGNDLEQQLDGADNAFAQIGKSANDALQDVNGLSQGIANAVGEKLISFKIAEKALDAAKEVISFAIGEAVQGSVENGLMLALTGDAELSEARNAVKDAVDRSWSGRVGGEETTGIVATVDTALGNVAGSDPEQLERVTNYAILQQEAYGQDVGSQMQRAKALVNTYGESWERVFDLMTKGYQDSADGGEMLNDMLDKNAQLFKQMGYDADDMFSVVLNAVNNEELGKDSNLNKGMLELINTVTGGGEQAKETLTALGIEATDIGYKAQQGGDTAAAAYQLILEKLLAIEDVDVRDKLGKALFGDGVWTSTGGEIAGALLAGFGQTIEADGSTQAAMDALLDNLGDNWAGTVERAGQQMGEATQPLVEGVNDFLKDVNEKTDQFGGDVAKGFSQAAADAIGEGVGAAGAQVEAKVAEIGEAVMEAAGQVTIGNELSERLSENFFGAAQEGTDTAEADATAQRWIDVLTGSVDSAAAGAEPSDAIQTMLDGMLPDTTVLSESMKTYAESHKTAVIEQMETVYGQENDEDFAAWKVFQQAMINSAYEDNVREAGQLGVDTADSLVEAISGKEGDAERAGDDLGGAGVSGAEDGLDGMYDAGKDGAAGLVSGLGIGVSGAYSKGYAAGQAYERGYRAAVKSASPSRVMEEAGHDTVAGLFEAFDEDSAELYRRAAYLGEAVAEGYSDGVHPAASAGGAAPAEGIDYARIGQEVAQAISGMVLGMDARRAGDVLELYVSQAQSSRAESTTQGMSTRVKGW